MRVKSMVLMSVLIILLTACTLPRAEEGEEKTEIKPALIVMDVQNTYVPRMAAADRDSGPYKINEAIALFREFGHPVIRVYHTDPKRGPKPGTESFEFPDSIAVLEDDVKVIKNHPSAFADTNLEEILRAADRNTVFLCGLSATGCVLATYFGGMERDFMIFMVQEALLSHNAEYTHVIEDICYSVSLEDLRQVLEDPYILN